jgi:hypothetical protein
MNHRARAALPASNASGPDRSNVQPGFAKRLRACAPSCLPAHEAMAAPSPEPIEP